MKRGLATTELWVGNLTPVAAIIAIANQPVVGIGQGLCALAIAAVACAYVWSRTSVKASVAVEVEAP